MKAATKNRGQAGDRYLELVRIFPLRPLRNKGDFARATEVMDGLAAREEGSLSRDEQDYLETLSLLVEEYDSRQPLETVGARPIEVLKHLMDAHEMNTSDLGRLLGSKGVASEVLNGKRSLSKTHIAILAAKFNVDVSLFFPMPRKR
jgi:HTH-type transcriptional regulator/antitoxin HigA